MPGRHFSCYAAAVLEVIVATVADIYNHWADVKLAMPVFCFLSRFTVILRQNVISNE
jgi:hypothetical protein